VSSYDSVRQGQRVATLTATWDAPLDKNGKPQADVIAYRVQWKRGDNEWVNVPETGLRNIEVPVSSRVITLSESGQLTLAGPQVYGQLQLSRI
jgi:hypothetical protein